jgi:hypothetical protein
VLAHVGTVVGHPLFVLLVGAALTGLLIPMITRRWQDERQNLERRAALTREINEAVATFFGAIQLMELTGGAESLSKFDEAYVDWRIKSETIRAELSAYFDEVTDDWLTFGAAITGVYYFLKNDPGEARESTLEAYEQYLGANPEEFPTLINTPLTKTVDVLALFDVELNQLWWKVDEKKEHVVRRIQPTAGRGRWLEAWRSIRGGIRRLGR